MLVWLAAVGTDAGSVRGVGGLAGRVVVGPTKWVGIGSAFA
jgi:hypothetical protein